MPVQIQPNKLLGVLGEHDGYPVEHIDLSHDQTLLRCAYAESSVLDACISQGRAPGETIEAADDVISVGKDATFSPEAERERSSVC